MKIKEAIQVISKEDSLIGQSAYNVIYKRASLTDFVRYIKDQFNEGNGASMSVRYGYEVINTIIKFEL